MAREASAGGGRKKGFTSHVNIGGLKGSSYSVKSKIQMVWGGDRRKKKRDTKKRENKKRLGRENVN